MRTATTPQRDTQTFLTHIFGPGLDDDRYVVERFRSMADGEIRRRTGDEPPAKGRRKAKGEIVSLRAVQQMRPARDEIIVCTGMRLKGGVQYWGDLATGLFAERKRG